MGATCFSLALQILKKPRIHFPGRAGLFVAEGPATNPRGK